MNKVMLIGRLARDPELRYTQQGNAVCTFTLAVDRNYKDDAGVRPVDFIQCQAWRKTAEFISNHFGKGNRIALEGSIQVQNYEDKDGNKRWSTKVNVEAAEFCESKKTNGQAGGGQDPADMYGEEIEFTDDELPF